MLSEYCRLVLLMMLWKFVLNNIFSEFLVHAADVEGLCQGIDEDLVRSTSATPPLRPIIDKLFCRTRGVGEDTYYVRRRRQRYSSNTQLYGIF